MPNPVCATALRVARGLFAGSSCVLGAGMEKLPHTAAIRLISCIL